MEWEPQFLRSLAQRFGTPLYLYDAAGFHRQYQLLRDCLPAPIQIFYAMKANPLRVLVQQFVRAGCGAEVASEGELTTALEAGVSSADIIYTCPGKTRAGLALAIRSKVACVNLESLEEAEEANVIARQLGRTIEVSLRINPLSVASRGALSMSGCATQFGVDEEHAGEAFRFLRRHCENLQPVGIHVFSGTQILAARTIVEDAQQTLELACRLSQECGFPLRFIDLGGGFGVPYADSTESLDLTALSCGYARVWRQYQERVGAARVLVEAGRFLVAGGGLFLTSVLARKDSRDRVFVVCDGGYAHHPASLYIARTARNRHQVTLVGSSTAEESVTIAGPSGTPVDIVAQDVALGKASRGDLLAVGMSGAYGYTNSCQLFYSGPSPAEVLIQGGQALLLRRRGSLLEERT
jgi:diaminopimelate decarboxylase